MYKCQINFQVLTDMQKPFAKAKAQLQTITLQKKLSASHNGAKSLDSFILPFLVIGYLKFCLNEF